MNANRKLIAFFFLLFSFTMPLSAQKVGLVLSGGGAKGLTHIGVIKALEENNIPIDYITGTSIGAIVGALYAIGMTPDEMIELFKSEDFKYWFSGEIETRNKYYYYNSDRGPSFIDLNFHIEQEGRFEIRPNLIPTNLMSPIQMNLAFIQLFATANAVAESNFNKLLVPFRCVASDVHEKKAVVFAKGDLGNAVRASMTYPFMFKPIKIDGRLLFDGGIFDNFPVEVMRKNFHPGFMIGSIVGANPRRPEANDVMSQIENMVINITNYNLPKKDGEVLVFDLSDVNLFDFSPVDKLVKMGYDSTLVRMKRIKARIARRTDSLTLAKRRCQFKSCCPALRFKGIRVNGVDSLQKNYVKRFFDYDDKAFDMEDFKKKYFMLLSDNKLSEILPTATYNAQDSTFDLSLEVKTEDQLKIQLGGNISPTTSNQAFFGLTYQHLSDYAFAGNISAQFGKTYNALGLDARIDIPWEIPMYFKMNYLFHRFSFYESVRWFYEDNPIANFSQTEVFGKLKVGLPISRKGRLEIGGGYGVLMDRYQQNIAATAPESASSDRSRYSLANLFLRVEGDTQNNPLYPISGYRYLSTVQLLLGEKVFLSGKLPDIPPAEKENPWLQYRGIYDSYIKLKDNFLLGLYSEVAFSTRQLSDRYMAAIIQAPAFAPTPHSKAIFNVDFSANQFLALGLKPIYRINDQIHLRGECYAFLPYQPILPDIDGSTLYKAPALKNIRFLSEASLVFDLKLISASLYANYYGSSPEKWNLGVNIGFLLFRDKFIE